MEQFKLLLAVVVLVVVWVLSHLSRKLGTKGGMNFWIFGFLDTG